MWLSDGRKSFPIGLAVLIQYRSVTATQPASHVAVAITLNAKGVEPNKTRPGLVALYDIWPGNGAGPFLQRGGRTGQSSEFNVVDSLTQTLRRGIKRKVELLLEIVAGCPSSHYQQLVRVPEGTEPLCWAQVHHLSHSAMTATYPTPNSEQD